MPLRRFKTQEIEPKNGIFLLAPIGVEYAPGFLHFLQTNAQYFTGPFPITMEKASHSLPACKNWIREKVQMQMDGSGLALLVLNANTDVIGFVSAFHFDWRVPKCELAWMLDKQHEGHGIINTALTRLIDFLFEECNVEKIICRVQPENTKSRQLAQKLNFREEGMHISDYRDGHNQLVDVIYFGLLRNEKG